MQQANERLRVIKLILLGQFLAMLSAGAVGLLASGSVTGLSALLGGGIAWLPNMYFAMRAFRYRGARAAQKIVRSFYAGAFGKLLLTMALFSIVFIQVRPINALALFLGFALVQTLNWIVPLVLAIRDSRRSNSKSDSYN